MELARRTAGLQPQDDVIALLLADKRSPNTKAAYQADLIDFFEGEPNREELNAFLAQDAGGMAYTLNAYKASLLKRGLSEKTVNRRLSAVRSLIRFARKTGACSVDPRGLVDSEKVRSYRDTRGIGLEDTLRLLDAPDTTTMKGKRDKAILLLFCENVLRRAEVQKTDVSDFRPYQAEDNLRILGKGSGTQYEWITLSSLTIAALMDYLTASGRTTESGGPLFLSCPKPWLGDPQRICLEGFNKLVEHYGKAAGIERRLSPHRLRHTGITLYLDDCEGDIRKAQKLSRHSKIETLMIYDDNRRNFQAEATNRLSALLAGSAA